MTLWNGNIFCVNGLLCGEFTGHRWIPLTKASEAELQMMFPLICAWTNGWVNNWGASDLRHHRAHYDVTVMVQFYHIWFDFKHVLINHIRRKIKLSRMVQKPNERIFSLCSSCWLGRPIFELFHTLLTLGWNVCPPRSSLKCHLPPHPEGSLITEVYCATPTVICK